VYHLQRVFRAYFLEEFFYFSCTHSSYIPSHKTFFYTNDLMSRSTATIYIVITWCVVVTSTREVFIESNRTISLILCMCVSDLFITRSRPLFFQDIALFCEFSAGLVIRPSIGTTNFIDSDELCSRLSEDKRVSTSNLFCNFAIRESLLYPLR